VNGYGGQGESERMNKQIKKFRTTTRNRQSHAVTSAYMELDSIYEMVRTKSEGPKLGTYLECLRDKYRQLQEDAILEAEERELANMEAGGQIVANDFVDDEDDVPENEYFDVPDIGRDALLDLLNAPAMIGMD
jgi:hypothetical protein